MATSVKSILAVAGAALLLGACADEPYYGYGYGPDAYYSAPSYGYYEPGYYERGYYDPGYVVGPSVGFGLAFGDDDWGHHEHHEWHGDRGHAEHEWHEHHH